MKTFANFFPCANGTDQDILPTMENLTFDKAALSALVQAEVERSGSLRNAESESAIGYSVLSKLASGKVPKVETLYFLATWLGVEMPDWRKICSERNISVPPT